LPVPAFTRLDPDRVDWSRLDAFTDRVVFQTRPWLDYLTEGQQGEPVVAVLREGPEELGWFTGLVTRRFGIPILGSPFPGWTTQYMGFNLADGVSRRLALEALIPFAFEDLGCAHLEVSDRWMRADDVAGLSVNCDPVHTFALDLRADDPTLLAGMNEMCRRNIRKAERNGVVIDADAEPEGFAADYHAQLVDVFAKQGLTPPYPVERVQSLIDRVHPSGRLQLLRARAPDGTSIGTAIIVGAGSAAYFWGGASWREYQHLRPNEPIMWQAFRTWRDRGAIEFDMGGGGEYKRKFGVEDLAVPHIRVSRLAALDHMRNLARKAVAARQKASYALHTSNWPVNLSNRLGFHRRSSAAVPGKR
jgi:hypothetical protein